MKKLKVFLLSLFFSVSVFAASDSMEQKYVVPEYETKSLGEMFAGLYDATGIKYLIKADPNELDAHGDKMDPFSQTFGRLIMIIVAFLLFYLAIKKGFEPLLLIPIGFGGLLANIPIAGIAGPDGLLGILYGMGIETGLFPLLIFMGVGAMTDFGPLIANPKVALLGAAAQFGIFGTLVLYGNQAGIQVQTVHQQAG